VRLLQSRYGQLAPNGGELAEKRVERLATFEVVE